VPLRAVGFIAIRRAVGKGDRLLDLIDGEDRAVTSQSSSGSAQIVLQFDMDRDVDGAARDVQAAINAARGSLPTTLTQTPTYRKMNTGDVYLQGVYQHVSGTGDSGIHAVINGLSASDSNQQAAVTVGMRVRF
jgi:hypothetical protein